MTKKPNKNASSEKEEEKRDEELDEKSSSASDHFSLSDPDLTFEEILKQYDLASSNERAGLVGSVDDAFFKSTISNSKVGGAFMTSVLPQFNKFYDFRRAVERPNEFVLPSQRQARADVTFWVPHRNAPVPFDRPMTERELLEACVPVTFILEHKAQSGRYENAHTVAQAGLYTHIVGYQQVIERRRPFRQPIPVVVFNGSDVNVGPFLYGDYFPIDEELAEWGIHWKINCVNLTRLFVEGNLPDEPIARSLGIAMGASGAGTLHKDYPLAFEALSEIQEWDDPFNENYTRSLSVYCRLELRKKRVFLAWQKIVDAMTRAVPERVRTNMKTLLQELKDEGFEQGIEQGIVKGELRKQLDAIAKLLSYKYGDETGAALRKIGSITNVDLLESIYDLSLRSEGLEQIERYVDEILATNPNATRPLEEILKERGIGR